MSIPLIAGAFLVVLGVPLVGLVVLVRYLLGDCSEGLQGSDRMAGKLHPLHVWLHLRSWYAQRPRRLTITSGDREVA